jgi:hypothetical protein
VERDLFLAILALDSYNRGYGFNVRGLLPSGKLGNAAIVSGSLVLGGTPDDREDEPAGFYATAYKLPLGYTEDLSHTVISHRGEKFDSDGLPYATASSPLRWMTERSRSAGPPGFFAPRSQSETRFFDTLR